MFFTYVIKIVPLLPFSGALKPLVDIDLGARYHTWAKIIFIYNGLEIFTEKVHVVQPVGKLRKHLAKCLALPIK